MRAPHQCVIGDHVYGSCIDADGRRLCDLCGRPQHPGDTEDDDSDFYESNDLEDTFERLMNGGVIDERCDNW